MFKKYIAYLKDNPEGYWFKRKIWGWGWTPVTWQGWATLFLYISAIIIIFKNVDAKSHSNSDTLIGTAPLFIVVTTLLIFICYRKGEKPKWQWGFPIDR